MSQALFVSANRLKRDTAIGGSVDDDLIRPYVFMAQQRWILPVLGTKLYDKITTDIDAGNVSGNYATLLNDYIIPSTVQYSFVQLVPFLRLRFVNNAVVVNELRTKFCGYLRRFKTVNGPGFRHGNILP